MISKIPTRCLSARRAFATAIIVIVSLMIIGVKTTYAQTQEPSPGKIAYITMTKQFGDDVLAVMDDDGSNPQRLFSDGSGLSEPAWSPDGKQIVLFASDNKESWRSGICVIGVSEGKKRCLTSSQEGSDPIWSPDGKSILYINKSGNGMDFYTMNSDGTGIRQLTTSGTGKSHPSWSPDGKQIVYLGETAESWEIFVMNADGTGKRQLTTFEECGGCAHKESPVWSPDGKYIAFQWGKGSTLPGLNFGIYIMNTDGTNIHMLTPPDLSVAYPTWSPDSQKIAFVAYQWNTDRSDIDKVFIDTINVDGSALKTLLQDSVYLASPTWIKGTGE